MNEREFSQKLEDLANKLDEISDSDEANWFREVRTVAQELRKLSNEKYAPGNSLSWDAVKPKKAKPQGGFISKTGKRLPF